MLDLFVPWKCAHDDHVTTTFERAQREWWWLANYTSMFQKALRLGVNNLRSVIDGWV